MDENVIYFIVAYQESKLGTGDMSMSETSLPQAITTLKIARQCLYQIRDECAKKRKVSPVMEDAFTIIFENKHVVTWTILTKPLIADFADFMLN